jgi:Ca2+-binding RTX toxin-like protein
LINYSGDPVYREVFEAAAARWGRIITSPLDLTIDVTVAAIDGASGTVARAEVTRFGGNGLPSNGTILVDAADIAQMDTQWTLDSTALHEIGHVLGLGELWGPLISGSLYAGQYSLAEYRAYIGDPSAPGVPVDGGHWSEIALSLELMTPFISSAYYSPLSRITIGSLRDIGYTVDMSEADPFAPRVNGTTGGDTMVGTSSTDMLIASDGNDYVLGQGGDDFISGGYDRDTLYGGQGDDIIDDRFSGFANLYGNEGNDTIAARQGDNTIIGGQDQFDGNDSIRSGDGSDIVWGNGGNDTLRLGGGANTAIAGYGFDIVLLGAGNDIAYGNQDNDSVDGGLGNDLIFGGRGDDTIAPGAGNDTIYGNEGADILVFLPGSGSDVIVGFSTAEGDVIDLQGQSYTRSDNVLMLSGGGTILLS